MSVSLSKGGNVSLSKAAPSMKNVLVGLGWDARSTDGQDFDLDASAFLLASNGKVRGDSDFIFYNNLTSSDGSSRVINDDSVSGLSPLARGTRTQYHGVLRPRRFIPAGAGNTSGRVSEPVGFPVYPRWRGEHTKHT